MSSDSGSQGQFREMEDGFAAYAASKSALNMALRHMAAELKRKDDDTIILAMHPGEVQTDMANISVAWQVHGVITPEESVGKMLNVIQSKGIQHSGTFWTWEDKVSTCICLHCPREIRLTGFVAIRLVTNEMKRGGDGYVRTLGTKGEQLICAFPGHSYVRACLLASEHIPTEDQNNTHPIHHLLVLKNLVLTLSAHHPCPLQFNSRIL